MPANNLLLRSVNDKVHAPVCRDGFTVGGSAPHLRSAATEQQLGGMPTNNAEVPEHRCFAASHFSKQLLAVAQTARHILTTARSLAGTAFLGSVRAAR